MTDTDHYLEYLREHNFVITLGEIMKTRFACEYRKHHSLLRGKGYEIDCERAKPASNNVYRVTVAVKAPAQYKYEGQQGVLI